MQTNKQTNEQTNRQINKHPYFINNSDIYIYHGLLEYTDGKVKTTVKNVKTDLIKIGKVNEFTSVFLQLLDILLGY